MEKKTNKIVVERETFVQEDKTYYSYFIKGKLRGKDVKIAVVPPIILSAEEQCWMAYHEAGHAVVAVALPEILPVVRVSMIPPPGEEGFGSVRFADDTRCVKTPQIRKEQ